MKHYLIIQLLFLCTIAPAMAQYYSVNYDTRTVAEMSAAFGTEAATEAYYAQQIAKIREHYQAAEVAAAGIFQVPRPQSSHKSGTLDQCNRELLLPPYIQHGVCQNYAQNMDSCRHDA